MQGGTQALLTQHTKNHYRLTVSGKLKPSAAFTIVEEKKNTYIVEPKQDDANAILQEAINQKLPILSFEKLQISLEELFIAQTK